MVLAYAQVRLYGCRKTLTLYKAQTMTNAAIRQQLHKYIDTMDDKKIEALYTLLQNDTDQKYQYSEEELAMLHDRAVKYMKGEGKTYRVEESHNLIKQQRKK
jgi:hypothetical protein